jgi:hypothetical protein
MCCSAGGGSKARLFVNPFERAEIGPDLFGAARGMGLVDLVSKRGDRPNRKATMMTSHPIRVLASNLETLQLIERLASDTVMSADAVLQRPDGFNGNSRSDR